MPGRILNFSEFFDKYSKDSGKEEKNLDTFTQSASNFEEGFDKETYDTDQLGPNRPVASETGVTPAAPGESGTPAFSSKINTEMEAPEEPEIKIESPEAEKEEQKTSPESEESQEVPEPEAGANPKDEKEKKEEVKESKGFNGVKTFAQFVTESEYLHDPEWEDEHSHKEEYCESCGEPYDEFGATCGCNM